jgi:hypothetical protein
MDWMQFIIFVGSFVGLFFWNRSESRADIRHMDGKIEAHRTETNTILRAIQDEMKDFHGRLEKQDMEFRMRLIAIEERRGK